MFQNLKRTLHCPCCGSQPSYLYRLTLSGSEQREQEAQGQVRKWLSYNHERWNHHRLQVTRSKERIEVVINKIWNKIGFRRTSCKIAAKTPVRSFPAENREFHLKRRCLAMDLGITYRYSE